MLRLCALTILITSTTVLHTAAANEIDLTGSLAAGTSSSSDDGVASASLRGRYAWHPNVGVGVSLIAAAGESDERSIGAFALTAVLGESFGRWRPALRIGFIHQHETPREDFESSPFTVTLGVDDAISHRTGALAEIGSSIDLASIPYGVVFAAADFSAQVMFDRNGPRAYMLLGLGVGFRYGAI